MIKRVVNFLRSNSPQLSIDERNFHSRSPLERGAQELLQELISRSRRDLGRKSESFQPVGKGPLQPPYIKR